jgi:hypothetical protein
MQLYEYQEALKAEALDVLKKYRIAYLNLEMRLGKTIISLNIAHEFGAERVLFVTKKKAIPSILKDFVAGGFEFKLIVTNYEQLQNLKFDPDFVIVDEAHSLGAYPKPSQRTKLLRDICNWKPLLLLSGTPSAESYSQLFHQFWISANSPWHHYKTFYRWADSYVSVRKKMINGMQFNDYSHAIEYLVQRDTKPFFVSYTQTQAGFRQSITETVITLKPDKPLADLMKRLLRDRVYIMANGGELVADTAAKLMSKLHQISSGTVKDEKGNGYILDTYKAEFIRDFYHDKKIAVFYNFIQEGEMLRQILPAVTEDCDEFNRTGSKVFISQIQSGSMGVNLSTADVIIFFNIHFSGVLYWQARNRMQEREREKPAVVHFLFSDIVLDQINCTFEERVYKAVMKKKKYTENYFKKDFGLDERVNDTSQNIGVFTNAG